MNPTSGIGTSNSELLYLLTVQGDPKTVHSFGIANQFGDADLNTLGIPLSPDQRLRLFGQPIDQRSKLWVHVLVRIRRNIDPHALRAKEYAPPNKEDYHNEREDPKDVQAVLTDLFAVGLTHARTATRAAKAQPPKKTKVATAAGDTSNGPQPAPACQSIALQNPPQAIPAT